MLWPLGGVAYVDPPQRPGATLWSIAAGPLVNVALFPVLWAAVEVVIGVGSGRRPNVHALLWFLTWRIDLGLLIFNMLPIYPLDGGQILRSLLWFVLGRARSLMVATILGFLGVRRIHRSCLLGASLWLGVIAIFMLMNCWGGLRHAQALLHFAKLPRRNGFVCPACKTSPPIGDLWKCGRCGQPFDIFQTQGVCPNCSDTVCGDQVPGLRRSASHNRVGHARNQREFDVRRGQR